MPKFHTCRIFARRKGLPIAGVGPAVSQHLSMSITTTSPLLDYVCQRGAALGVEAIAGVGY